MVIGTTIETNKENNLGKAPKRIERYSYMNYSKQYARRMISIEPIMDFHLKTLIQWMKLIEPEFISIGADSKGHNLPEPNPQKIRNLIRELKKFTRVIQKDNLKRLLVV
jgi:hypothetical protein